MLQQDQAESLPWEMCSLASDIGLIFLGVYSAKCWLGSKRLKALGSHISGPQNPAHEPDAKAKYQRQTDGK